MTRLSSLANHRTWQVVCPDSEEEAVVSDNESLYSSYRTPVEVEAQPLPEVMMDIPIVVSSPQINWVRTCCLGCKEVDLSQVPLILVETPMRNPFDINQGRAACRQVVCGQHAC